MHWVCPWTACWLNTWPQSMQESCEKSTISSNRNINSLKNKLATSKGEGSGPWRQSTYENGREASASSGSRHNLRTETKPSLSKFSKQNSLSAGKGDKERGERNWRWLCFRASGKGFIQGLAMADDRTFISSSFLGLSAHLTLARLATKTFIKLNLFYFFSSLSFSYM